MKVKLLISRTKGHKLTLIKEVEVEKYESDNDAICQAQLLWVNEYIGRDIKLKTPYTDLAYAKKVAGVSIIGTVNF